MVENKLGKKILFVALLLLALWLLVDDEATLQNNNDDGANPIAYRRRHHLAAWTALRRHPPCSRIFRALLEFDLMLWGLAVSLWLWKNTVGEKMTGYLLFQPAGYDESKDRGVYFTDLGVDHGTSQMDHGDDAIDINDTPMFDDQFNNDASTFELIEPPSPMGITYAALDSLILILVTLFMFTLSSAEGGRYVDGMETLHTFRFVAIVAAPVFPLVLFFVFCVGLVVPFRKRKSQWIILGYTIGAPLYHVTFRDGFIGDILTSSVRPLQDIAFTTFYLLSGLQGWWQQSYDLDAADLPLESNWFLHTTILPMCMMSPLWYRFCQNLRQTYEYKSRWPYLGNALKYFIAAEVGIFGVYSQSPGQSKIWLMGFVAATLYQIWWDVFMDWQLLRISDSLRLRKTRIYSVSWLYWGVFGINIVLRFCWTLSFLPPHYLNRAGVLSDTFDGDLSAYLNPIIASAEIIRRTMWGWLRLEYEAIKVARKEPRLKGTWTDYDDNDEGPDKTDSDANNIEFKTMTLEDTLMESSMLDETIPSPSFSRGSWIPKKMYEMTELQILGELCIYATVFTGLGLLAAAHRDTF
eukprot:jgi/Psemu1/261103/estExt_Genewise1Plus.C_5290033